MKRLITLITLSVFLSATALAGGSHHHDNHSSGSVIDTSGDNLGEFFYNGQYYETERLSLKKIETVYEEHWVDSTCYKEEVYFEEECGYQDVTEQVCTHTPSKKECKMVNGKLKCEVVPGKTVCRDVVTTKWVCGPVKKYQTVAYSCKKKEVIEVEKVNKRFIANLRFRFNYTDLNPALVVKSELNEEGEVSVTASNVDGSSVLLLGTKSVEKRENGIFEMSNINYDLSAYDKDSLLSHVASKPSDIRVSRLSMDFEVGRVLFPERAKFRIKIVDLRTNDVLINRDLEENEYRMSSYYYGDTTQVYISSLRSLGVELRYNRDYRVKVVSKVDIGELEMLNSDVESLKSAKTVRVNL